MSELPRLLDGPAEAPLRVLLAHGAGAPMDSPFMETMAAGLAAAGFQVVRFEFPYMAARRRDGRRPPPNPEPLLREAWRQQVAALGDAKPVVIGGKSLGGRIASLVADECGAAGLLCLGYPFHPSGRPERTRIAHLRELRTPTLILQGERDSFGRPEEVAQYPLSPAVAVQWVPDGDHSFRPRKSSGRTEEENLRMACDAAVAFLRRLGA